MKITGLFAGAVVLVAVVGCGGSHKATTGDADGNADVPSDTPVEVPGDVPADTPGDGSAVCGNGILETGETCDDGNGVDYDACPDGALGSCQDAYCGDGIRRRDIAPGNPGHEQCDDGNTANGDGCDSTCQFEGTCGDGTLDGGEECDLGTANDDNAPGDCPAVCRSSCLCPYCGDGVSDFVRGEECDDGNIAAGDGCDGTCHVEAATSCGDGVLDIDMGEECDDGNTTAGDGCSPACQFETLGATCGDGTPDHPLEKCDDGNTTNGDGCNSTCNLTTTVTTLATGIHGSSIAVDTDYLWIGVCDPPSSPTTCEIQRIDIDACLTSGSCTPTTVAGGTCGTPSDGTGTSAVLACPNTITTDGHTLWFANQHTVRAMDQTSFAVTTLAGSPNSCAAVDGTGSTAYFHDIRGLTYYGGYVYLLDGCEEVLRRLDPATGTVVTIAGTRVPDPTVTPSPPYTCVSGFSCVSNTPVDGYGLSAVFGSPRYMTADHSGNLYITDTNGTSIRSYNLVTGWVGTMIGGAGYTDGVGSAVRLTRPRGLTSDGTSIYFNEQTMNTIRQLIITGLDTSTMIAIRGCAGSRDGVGGDGSQDWSVPGCGTAPSTMPQITTPMGAIAYHFPSQSIFLLEGDRLRRIE